MLSCATLPRRQRSSSSPVPVRGTGSTSSPSPVPFVVLRTSLDSSNLSGAEYDPDTGSLVVTFRSGGAYRYLSVPENVYEGLVSAPSPGRYLNEQIKPVYSGSRA